MANRQITKRKARHNRVRAKVAGTADRPRLAVFRSNTNIYAQLIDDEAGTTLVAANGNHVKATKPTERAAAVGAEIAKRAKDKGISKVVFDRGGFMFAGAVKALADGAREGGLEF